MSTVFDILLNQHINNFNNNHFFKEHSNIDFVPKLDVTSNENTIIIKTELPGVNKEDIQIEIKDSKLYIQGEKKRQSNNYSSNVIIPSDSNEINTNVVEKPKEKKYIQERSYGKFKRFIDLTNIIYLLDLSTIKTEYNNGVLSISINKKQDYSNVIKINL